MAWQHRIVKRATRGRNTISVSFAFVVVVVCSSGGDCWTEECAQVESAAKVEREIKCIQIQCAVLCCGCQLVNLG